LLSNLEHADLGTQDFDQLFGLLEIAHIEGDNQALSHGAA
jgi:hypothetical protein